MLPSPRRRGASEMRVEFTNPKSRGVTGVPETVLAEAEVFFDAMTVGAGGHAVPSPFSGLKLVGFVVRRGERGPYVTFPARAYGTTRERQYFDYVHSADPKGTAAAAAALWRLKEWILQEYALWAKSVEGGTHEHSRSAEPDQG